MWYLAIFALSAKGKQVQNFLLTQFFHRGIPCKTFLGSYCLCVGIWSRLCQIEAKLHLDTIQLNKKVSMSTVADVVRNKIDKPILPKSAKNDR